MSDINYGIHFENYSETVVTMLTNLLQNQSFVDVSLVCNSKLLKVHKVVLAAISPYFFDVFKTWVGDLTIILEMKYCVLESLIEYIYMGKTSISADLVDELIAAARFFQIKGLSELKDISEEVCHFPPPKIISQPSNAVSNTSDPNNINNFIFKIPIEIKKKHDLMSNDDYRNTTCNQGPYVNKYDEVDTRNRRSKKKMHHNKYASEDMGMRMLNKATRKALHKEERNSLETIQSIKNMHTFQNDSSSLQTFDLSYFSDNGTISSNILNDMSCQQSIIQNTQESIMGDSHHTLETIYDGNWNLDSGVVEDSTVVDYLNDLKCKDSADIPAILFQLEDTPNINEEVLLNMEHEDSESVKL